MLSTSLNMFPLHMIVTASVSFSYIQDIKKKYYKNKNLNPINPQQLHEDQVLVGSNQDAAEVEEHKIPTE